LRRRQATCNYKSETLQTQKETLEEKQDAMFPIQKLATDDGPSNKETSPDRFGSRILPNLSTIRERS